MKIPTLATFALCLAALSGCKDASAPDSGAPQSAASTPPAAETATLQVVTDANFAGFTTGTEVAVVDFWATWCGPCKQMAPIYESVSAEFGATAAFGKLDVDENPQSARQLGIQAIPTIAIFKNGAVVDKVVGVVSAEQLKARVQKQL